MTARRLDLRMAAEDSYKVVLGRAPFLSTSRVSSWPRRGHARRWRSHIEVIDCNVRAASNLATRPEVPSACVLRPLDLQEPFLFHPNTAAPPRVPRIRCGASIPKVIYQTYPTKNVPAAIAKNIDYIRNLNPTHDYVLFDDIDVERFIETEYGSEILAYYNRINPKYGAARADLFRYLLIYNKGGIYLDIKSRMLQPLDSILVDDDRIILAKWADNKLFPHGELAQIRGGEFQNWHIIAVKGHPFLKAVIEAVLGNIDTYRPWRHGVGKNAVIRVTGPIAYTLAIYPILDRHPKRVVSSQADLSLEYTIPIDGSHIRLFASHYSVLEESVVQLTGPAAYLSKLYFFLRLHLLLRAMKQLLRR